MTFDIHGIRKQFPVTHDSIYINHAGTGPMTVPARNAIEECLDIYARQAEFNIDDYFSRVARIRKQIARFINAEPKEITLTHNTSEGLFIALMNIPLRPGDTLIVMDEVFPAARYAVDQNLPHIQTRYVPFTRCDPVKTVQPYLDGTVKAVVVDLAQYLSGEMIDIRAFSAFLKAEGVYCIVDGIQAIGAIDISIHDTDVDFLSCGAAKWLFGPSGAGFLYINKKNFPILNKVHTGWLGAQWKGFEDCAQRPALYDDARMFEQGTRNIIGASAMAANLALLMNTGMHTVAQRIQLLKSKLRNALESMDHEILTPVQDVQSGILTARPLQGTEHMYKMLHDNHVTVSLRNGWLRFSPHYYNTEEEIDKVIGLLEKQ